MGDSTESLSKNEAEAMAELEAEFQRELERNAMAVRLLQQKAEEAKQAKQRADQSQKRMESMQEKYNHMQDKVETTKQTLQDAETTLARQDKIRNTVKELQERAKSFEEKTAQRIKSSQLFDSEICSGFEFPKPLIDYDAEEGQQIEKQIDESIASSRVKSEENVPNIDYAQTVLSLQEKLSRINSTKSPSPASESEKSASATAAASTDHVSSSSSSSLPTPVKEDPTIDLQNSVLRLEAKCEGVREELARMTLSEQYMRTKQAQLRAKKKELEAKEAMERAATKEREAEEMRKKVANMMKLLADRKTRLKLMDNAIDAKTDVVDKLNAIRDKRERREKFITKIKTDQVVFDKKAKKKK